MSVQFSSVQSLSRVELFVTPWTTAFQASLSITDSQSPPKPMCIESVMPSNHLIIYRPLLLRPSIFPSIRAFSMSQLFTSGGQRIGVSASKSVLPVNTQDWSPLGWTSWISLQSKGLSKVFTSTTVQKHQVFGIQPIDPQIVCAIDHSFKTIYWTNIMLGLVRMKKAQDSKPSQLWILYLMTVIPDIRIWSKNIFTSIPVL